MSDIKTYQFVQPKEDGVTPEVITMTEIQIIEEYWVQWSSEMRKQGKDERDITHDNCIEDWVTINWATEVK